MAEETNNEPKSLAEMTKEELMFELSQTTQGFGASWSLESLRAELLRRMEAGEELARVIDVMEKHCRGSMSQPTTKRNVSEILDKVLAADFRIGRERYEAEAEARRLREALGAYMFLEQTSGGLNPHRLGSNKYRAFELGKAALAATPEAGKD